MAFDSYLPPNSLHQILYLLNSPATCLHKRNVCAVRDGQTCCCRQFLPPFEGRQQKVNRWTAVVSGMLFLPLACLFFLQKNSFPLVPLQYASRVLPGIRNWNSLCLVLFVRHLVRIPPPTHSWFRNVLWLPSLVSTHSITSLSPAHSLFSSFELSLSPLRFLLAVCSSVQGRW